MYLKGPEVVQFDPNKKEHRKAVVDFRKRRAWGDTKIRFAYDPAYGSVANQVESKLLEWYIKKEIKA